MTDDLRVTVDGSVGTITLHRAAKRNAVTYDMWVALGAACHQLAHDARVRVVVLRGMAAEHALSALPKPVVAVVQGDCIGGGAALAIDCDLRIAVQGSRFGITPAKLGIVYPPASLERAVRLLGPAAKRLLYTGDLIDASEAHRIGLVDELLPPDEVEARVAALCATLAERSLLTQAGTKEMVAAVLAHGSVPADLAASWAREVAAAPDPAEGVAAFVERRAPNFTWSERTQD